MSDTPRTDALFDQLGPVAHPAAMAYFSLARELERQHGELREALRSSAMTRSTLSSEGERMKFNDQSNTTLDDVRKEMRAARSNDPSQPFFKTPPKTITRAEAERLRRECKEHQVIVEGKVALHFVRDEKGIIYLIDEAKAE